MIYDVIVDLPHHTLGGKLNFLYKPKMNELVELIPKATFRVTEISRENRKIKLGFKEIYHCVDVIGIMTSEMGFEIIDFSNMTRYL